MTDVQGLLIRKFADRSGGPEVFYADLPGAPPGTWPCAGVELVGEPPQHSRIAVKVVDRGRTEGWITVEGEQVVHRPGGPPDDLWRVTHTFRHYDTLTVCGVPYRVTHQPDKYADPGDDDTPVTDDVYQTGATRVDHFYGLELED